MHAASLQATAAPNVLVAHPDGEVHELAKAALEGRFRLKLARTRAVAIRLAESTDINVALLSGADGRVAADLAQGLRAVRPHARVVFLLGPNQAKAPWGLSTIGTVLPDGPDKAALLAAVERACSLSRMTSGVHALRRDSDPLFRAIRAIEDQRKHSEGLGPARKF